jgi:hypothetical protein
MVETGNDSNSNQNTPSGVSPTNSNTPSSNSKNDKYEAVDIVKAPSVVVA